MAIIDTHLSNVHSVARAIEDCGFEPVITDAPGDLETASRVILPGVGSFPEAMRRLTESGMAEALHEQVIGRVIPFLGICLGMQLLATTGYEGRPTQGLGWIAGDVRPLEPRAGERVPHVGWNGVDFLGDSPLFKGLVSGGDFYFVHSYVLNPSDPAVVKGVTGFAGGFVSAVETGLVFGVQFHPEKSQRMGRGVLRNFLAL